MAPDKPACTSEDNEIFYYSISTDNDGNVIYSNLAGRFPIESHTGMNYYFVCYVYKCNYIMVQTVKSRKDAGMVSAFKEVYKELKTKGHQPKLHVLDNECSKAVKHYIISEQTNIQLVEPHNHCVNAAEPAVKSLKYHDLAVFDTLVPNFPIQLWDRFTEQIEIPLILLLEGWAGLLVTGTARRLTGEITGQIITQMTNQVTSQLISGSVGEVFS